MEPIKYIEFWIFHNIQRGTWKSLLLQKSIKTHRWTKKHERSKRIRFEANTF